jgi:hypothetical protein
MTTTNSPLDIAVMASEIGSKVNGEGDCGAGLWVVSVGRDISQEGRLLDILRLGRDSVCMQGMDLYV